MRFDSKAVCAYMKQLIIEDGITSSIDLADSTIEHFNVYSDRDIILINKCAVQMCKS